MHHLKKKLPHVRWAYLNGLTFAVTEGGDHGVRVVEAPVVVVTAGGDDSDTGPHV